MAPAFLLSPTFWKLIGFAAVIAAAGLFYWHYESISAQAALVPGLQARITTDDARATALAQRMADVDKARSSAESALSAFEAGEQTVIANLKKASAHAAAQTNPVCAPSDIDRGMRNDALRQLLGAGQATGAASVPNAASGAH